MGLGARIAERIGGERSAVEPAAKMTAVWRGAVLAERDQTVKLEGNHYFPPDSLHPEFFADSRHKSVCPWKGLASYYTIEVDGERNEGAAWTYRSPSPLARKIKDHVAFSQGVEVFRAD
jgi:uncharacterized protein (DUF427 family)